MPSFQSYAKQFIVRALERTPADVVPDVYVVSLFLDEKGSGAEHAGLIAAARTPLPA